MLTKVKYKDWTISYWAKPIPDRRHDWDFVHKDYDGENNLCGTGQSIKDVLEQIREIEADV